jgi:hypothetical protein
MRGFEHTPELDEPAPPFQTDFDGHPMIRVEGEWIRWEEVKELGFRYEKDLKCLLDSNGDEWNYIPAQGLAKITRYNNVYPICCLSQAAIQALDNSVPKKPEEINNCCYLQLITDGTTRLSRIDHIAIRLIRQTGEVYSFGFETTKPFDVNCSRIPNLLTSYNAHISSQDFREFKRFTQRPTTTVALTDEQFNAALERVHDLTEMPLKTSILGPNCVSFVADVMHAAGLNVDTYRYPTEMLYDMLPSAEDIPYIGCILAKVRDAVKAVFLLISACVPGFIKTTLRWIIEVITYIPLKIVTIIRNIFFLSLGASNQAEAAVAPHDNPSGERELGNFRSLMPCWWKDIWRDEVGLISSPLALADWQDQQMKNNTYVHKYEDSPKLYIVPPKPKSPHHA